MSTSIFNVKDPPFNATGDGTTDDTAAFQLALDAIAKLSKTTFLQAVPTALQPQFGNQPLIPAIDARGAVLFVPFGTYVLRQPLNITRQMIIQGVSGAGDFAGSKLMFDRGIDGIVIHSVFTAPTEPDTNPPDARGRGDWTIIRDVALDGGNGGSFLTKSNCPVRLPQFDNTSRPDDIYDFDPLPGFHGHGIVLYARARIENCLITGFRFDGIHIESNDFEKNVNNWEVQNCRLLANGRHGLYIAGANANAGRAIGVDSSNNCRWGFYNRPFLGNTYIGCHTEANGVVTNQQPSLGGAYKTRVFLPESNEFSTANDLLLNCYSEGNNSEPPSDLSKLTMVVGGTHGAGFSEPPSEPPGDFNPTILTAGLTIERVSLSVEGNLTTRARTVFSMSASDSVSLDQRDLGQPGVLFVDANLAPLTVILPDPHPTGGSSIAGRQYTIKKIDLTGNVVQLSVLNGKLIEDQQVFDLKQPLEAVILVADETEWRVVSHVPGVPPSNLPPNATGGVSTE